MRRDTVSIDKMSPGLYTTGTDYVAFLPFKILVYGDVGTQTFTADIREYGDLEKCFPNRETVLERAELHRVWDVNKPHSKIAILESRRLPEVIQDEALKVLNKCDCTYEVFLEKLKKNPVLRMYASLEDMVELRGLIIPTPDPEFVRTTSYFVQFLEDFQAEHF